MYRAAEFKAFMERRGKYTRNTINTSNSYVNRIDIQIGGLDEKLQAEGVESVLRWAETASDGVFENYSSQAKFALKRYVEFYTGLGDDTEDSLVVEAEKADIAVSTAFHLEQEMQRAVRKQLSKIEPGLVEADGGRELSVATGEIDILATDTDGKLVVIELKAGQCPKGALEQTLGYAQSLSEERDKEVRTILIASEFPDRIKAAAKRVPGMKLLAYDFTLSFSEL